MIYKWKDITTYMRGEKERVPKTWGLFLQELGYKVVVTRHIYAENTWILRCQKADIEFLDLETDDIDEAKEKAITIIKNYLNELLLRVQKEIQNFSDDKKQTNLEKIRSLPLEKLATLNVKEFCYMNGYSPSVDFYTTNYNIFDTREAAEKYEMEWLMNETDDFLLEL